MGRPPIGDRAMTPAERQRRRRGRLAAERPETGSADKELAEGIRTAFDRIERGRQACIEGRIEIERLLSEARAPLSVR